MSECDLETFELALNAIFERQTGEAGAMPALSRNCIAVEPSGTSGARGGARIPGQIASNALREKGEDT